MRVVKKELRDTVMNEIALQYRENQKGEPKIEKVNIFLVWLKHDMSYSEFIDVILSLEAQEYLHYEKANKNKIRYKAKGESVPQEFVVLEPKAKSFPETLLDEKDREKKTNFKYPVASSIATMMITSLSPSGLKCWLSRILKWFLSLFHS